MSRSSLISGKGITAKLEVMGCLDANGLAGLFEAPAHAAREEIDRHLDACGSCRSLVAAYARLEGDGASGEIALAPTVPSERPRDRPSAGTGAGTSAGALVAQRYLLERVVGEGGMGVVWAARDLVAGHDVALKVLKGASPDLCKRFEREARVGSTLGHPNVVEVRAVLSLPDGTPALVMDLLRGRSLATELGEKGALGFAETLAILVPLVSAVRAAHAKGVVHRDLKPGNVFLAEDDDEGAPPVDTLLDFGLAKLVATDDAAAEKLTRTGAVLGTPHYMAPEQLLGEPASAPADVWAVGVIAHECLTGERPLEGKTFAQLVRGATRGAVRALPAELPIADVVGRMLAIDPAARPTMAEVHAELDAALRVRGA